MSKQEKRYEKSKNNSDDPIPKRKTKRPKRQEIKEDLKRCNYIDWDEVDWEKYGDE